MKILVWGAGERTRNCLEKNLFGKDCEIKAIVDSYSEITELKTYPVIKPDRVSNIIDEVDYIVICNQFFQEIIVILLEMGISLTKVVITDNCLEEPFCDLYLKAKRIFPNVFECTKHLLLRTMRLNEKDIVDNDSFYNDNRFKNLQYNKDYFRYRTFEFVSEEIINRNIGGVIAELGVFRGTFSAVINYRFPDRKLYLFDTFEGFSEDEAKKEIELGRCTENFIASHKDTSVEMMLGNLTNHENVVVCKGLFPDSITEEAEKENYAFVSLDVDFEDSTYEGLKFFYPRLTEGGYIFVHDYNTYFLEGVRNAVERYEKDIGEKLKIVPIADRAGTLIIVK